MKAPFKDRRNDLVKIFDPAGAEYEMTRTNAAEMKRHAGWSFTKPAKDEPASVVAPSAPKTDTAPVVPVVPPKPQDGLAEMQALGKEILKSAAKTLRVDVDGRANIERLTLAIEATLDKRLSESGDHDGAYVEDLDDSPDQIARKHAEAEARRRRAYKLEAEKNSYSFEDFTLITDFLKEAAAEGE